MRPEEYLLQLAREALEGLEAKIVPLSATLRKAIRIARLREDWANLWWLKWEMIQLTTADQRRDSQSEILAHLSAEGYSRLRKAYVSLWLSERECASINEHLEIERGDNVQARSVEEIEALVQYYEALAEDAVVPTGLHPLDTYFENKATSERKFTARTIASELTSILGRIRQRTHDYLGQVEAQLVYGQFHADLFERNRNYVIERLGALAPEALAMFTSATERLSQGDKEARPHALLSCRRLLKALSDVLYPASGDVIVGPDGRERAMTDDAYINRLWQFVTLGSAGAHSGALLQAEVEDIGHRIDRLYDLASKGVHADVSEFEVSQAILQTYVVIGDLLRLREGTSAIGMEHDDLDPVVGAT